MFCAAGELKAAVAFPDQSVERIDLSDIDSAIPGAAVTVDHAKPLFEKLDVQLKEEFDDLQQIEADKEKEKERQRMQKEKEKEETKKKQKNESVKRTRGWFGWNAKAERDRCSCCDMRVSFVAVFVTGETRSAREHTS